MKTNGVKLWNNIHPIGSVVAVLRGSTSRKMNATLTTGRAFVSNRGESLVWLCGYPLPVNLKRVKAI